MNGKYLKVDGEGLIELLNLYKTNFNSFIEELNKYDKQLFLYELNNSDIRDEQINEFVNIFNFMRDLFKELNAEQDWF